MGVAVAVDVVAGVGVGVEPAVGASVGMCVAVGVLVGSVVGASCGPSSHAHSRATAVRSRSPVHAARRRAPASLTLRWSLKCWDSVIISLRCPGRRPGVHALLLAGLRCMPAVGMAQRGLRWDDLMNSSILACERHAVEGRPKS